MWCWLGLRYGCLLILFLYCYYKHHHHHEPTSSYVASDSLVIAMLGEFWSPLLILGVVSVMGQERRVALLTVNVAVKK